MTKSLPNNIENIFPNLSVLPKKRCSDLEIHATARPQEEEKIILEAESTAQKHLDPGRTRHQKNILETITDPLFILDQNWQFTYLNLQAETILFDNRQDLIHRNIWSEFPQLIGSKLEQELKKSVSQQVKVYFEEFCQILKLWLATKISPQDGEVVVYIRDINEKKQLEAALEERSRLLNLQAAISASLSKSGTLEANLQLCTQAMIQHLDAITAGIWTFNQKINSLELQALAHTEQTQTSSLEVFSQSRISLEDSIIGFVAQTHQPHFQQNQDHSSISHLSSYPLIVEDRLVGVMAINHSQPLSDTVHTSLLSLTYTIALGIDRAWAREALVSSWETLLLRLANQIRNSLDLDTILGTAVNEILTLLKIDRCQFLWCWVHPTHPTVSITHEARENPELPSLINEDFSQQLAALTSRICQLQPLRIDDVASEVANQNSNAEIHQLNSVLHNLGMTSVLLLPLKTRSGQLGAILCNDCSSARLWADSEVELLQAVVDQLAIAIDQAELFAQTRAAAFAAQTQAKQLELALNELKQTESHLIQAEKMSSLGQMVAGIAHEINNPVNFITGNLTHAGRYIQDLLELIDLYKECYPNPDSRIGDRAEEIDLDFVLQDLPKMLISMSMGADRIRQIVVSLRNFSRLDEAEKKPVDIHEGIDNTLLILHHRLKANGTSPEIQIIKEYGKLPLVDCYAGQLNQVFMNIISNAIDALDGQPEPATVTIQTEVISSQQKKSISETDEDWQNELPPTDNVVIRIRDNGPGMPENVRKRLFDPFFTTKPVGKGTGLGLSISYQIVVEKHRGSLKCLSGPGQGAEFLIEIPLAQ